MNNALEIINDKNFLSSLYGFAYKRVSNSYEAEDLCSDIIYAVISAINRNSDISNPYAFIWTIARRVYANFSKKRRFFADNRVVTEYSDGVFNINSNLIDDYIENENDKFQVKRIMREICFLSKIYRDVCVMYYLDEMKISDIAKKLEIKESAVKQRLYSSREAIKKGVVKMDNSNLTLKPIDIAFLGSGNPVGNDPSQVAYRSFSKNLIYLCKDIERSIKELSEQLSVPMPFIEEEVDIQVNGQNGYYGLLKKTENGKYISNFIIIDYDDYIQVNEMYKKNIDLIVRKFDKFIRDNEKKILSMPFLNKQTDARLIAWPLIAKVNWKFSGIIENKVEEKYFSNINQIKRDFYTFGIAINEGQQLNNGFYGCDGIDSRDIGGYKEIYMSNMYGKRLQKHFQCGHNISQDAQILLTVKTINGLPVSSLSEDEKETAAKAIESGYIKKENDMLFPKILISEEHGIYEDILVDFVKELDKFAELAADEIYKFILKYVPKYLMGEYKLFIQQTSCGLLGEMIEKCIELGTLIPPENPLSAEGVIMVVKK